MVSSFFEAKDIIKGNMCPPDTYTKKKIKKNLMFRLAITKGVLVHQVISLNFE
jgi:hypothetical protein